MELLSKRTNEFRQIWEKDIWQHSAMKDRSFRGHCFAVLRVISITLSGLQEINVASRAAALSYSSLLGIGPLIAIAVLISGIILSPKGGQSGNQDVAISTLNKIIQFIAPQVAEYEKMDRDPGEATAEAVTAVANGKTNVPPVAVNPELVSLINSFIEGTKSGAAGVLGALSLILIVIQLFTSVENAFNAIWGVRRGRSWLMRVVFYWTVVTLGAVLFFASITALSAGTFIGVFIGKLPFGVKILNLLVWMVPLFS